jgi:hypothetical protein
MADELRQDGSEAACDIGGKTVLIERSAGTAIIQSGVLVIGRWVAGVPKAPVPGFVGLLLTISQIGGPLIAVLVPSLANRGPQLMKNAEGPTLLPAGLAGRLCRSGAAAILAGFLACAPFSSAGAASVSAGLRSGYARFNGGIVGISEPGGAFYRDVTPGSYDITVDSDGRDVNQFARVTVAAGQQIYVEVDALRHSNCASGIRGGECRPTFYTLVRPPQAAASAIENSRFYGGN